jgi:hypothetical protein
LYLKQSGLFWADAKFFEQGLAVALSSGDTNKAQNLPAQILKLFLMF